MQHGFAWFFLFFSLAPVACAPDRNRQPVPLPHLSNHPVVVVLSFGGLSASFVTPDLTPNLMRLYRKCAKPEYLIPVFPANTSANHFSVATGLYADEHGVIDDRRPDRREYEQYDGDLNPIWIENQIHGGISGVLDWPGSQRVYQEEEPIHSIGPEKDPLDKMIGWLVHETLPANLVMAYFGELDKVLHEYGPNTARLNAIKRIDGLINTFIDKLERKGILKYIDLIILGTQGIHTAVYSNGISLGMISNYRFLPKHIPINSMGANAIVTPTEDEFKYVYDTLEYYSHSKIDSPKEKLYSVYARDDIPDDWHLKKSPAFEKSIFVVAEPGFFFWNDYIRAYRKNQIPKYNNHSNHNVDEFEIGMDRYNNNDKSMRTLFIAMGPSFRPRKKSPPFHTIDIHPLLRELLHLEGSISERQLQTDMNETVRKLLRGPMDSIEETSFENTSIEEDIAQVPKNRKRSAIKDLSKCVCKIFKPKN